MMHYLSTTMDKAATRRSDAPESAKWGFVARLYFHNGTTQLSPSTNRYLRCPNTVSFQPQSFPAFWSASRKKCTIHNSSPLHLAPSSASPITSGKLRERFSRWCWVLRPIMRALYSGYSLESRFAGYFAETGGQSGSDGHGYLIFGIKSNKSTWFCIFCMQSRSK